RKLLSNNGTKVNVQSVVKGKAGVILKFEEGYYIAVFGLVGLCLVAFLGWHWHCMGCGCKYNFNHKDQITNYWLLKKYDDNNIWLNILTNFLTNFLILVIYGAICLFLYQYSYHEIKHDEA
ncbi:40956_t:CDS:1, partial [Gigaspora margarita]